jgi:chromosome segregation ATPase
LCENVERTLFFSELKAGFGTQLFAFIEGILVALLIVNIAFSNAALLKKPNKVTYNVFNQLKSIEDEVFGKKILDTIALQLENKSPLGEIATMLAQIRQDLVIQQQEADMVHSQQEAECEAEITEYTRRIDEASATISTAESEIATLKAEISQIEGDIRNKGIQLDILDHREIDLKDSRARDAEDFERRQATSTEVVGALDLIIEKFATIAPHEDTEAVFAELAKIGSTNPIMALVQIASTFSPAALEKVQGKLEELRASLDQSITEDQQNEQAAIGEYQALLHELEETREIVAAAKDDAEVRLTQTKGALALQERILEEAVSELKSAQEGKIEKEEQCEDWRNKWAADKEDRSKEIGVVKQVEGIIATKLETMKDYMKERAGLNF